MLSVSTLRTNDQQQSFRPLVNSSIDQFLADRVPPTVQDLFQMVSVFDLLTMCQLLKSTLNWVIHRIQIRPVWWLSEVGNNNLSSPVRGAIYKRVTSVMTCIHFQLFIKEYLTHSEKFCINWQTVIFAEHFGANSLILRQTVVKWWCINLCVHFFLDHSV